MYNDWPKAEIQEWSESWKMKSIKLCSCQFGHQFHALIGFLHVHEIYFHLCVSAFPRKHKKGQSESHVSCDSVLDKVIAFGIFGS